MNTEGTLWMGDLESWICESFIIDTFQKFGFKPKYVKLITDKRINKFKNFCFVTFNNLEEANAALFKLNAKKIPKTNIFFKLNLAKNNPKIKKNLYVGNLPLKVNEIELFNFFKSKYPSVYYASIITDNGLSRGYGFIHFSNEKEYEKCLIEMDGATFLNKTIKVKEKNEEEPNKNKNINTSHINLLPYINNCMNFFFLPKKLKNEISSINNDNKCREFNEKEKENVIIPKTKIQNKSFSENIELLKKDDNKILYVKIQESIDKMLDNYYKKNKNFYKISKTVFYFSPYGEQKKNNISL